MQQKITKLFSEITQLRHSNFHQLQIDDFISHQRPSELVSEFLFSNSLTPTQYDLLLETLESIFQNEIFFIQYFLDTKNKPEIEKMLSFYSEEINELISRSLLENHKPILKYLTQKDDNQKQKITDSIDLLFGLFYFDSCQTFTNVKKLLQLMFKNDAFVELIDNDHFWNKVKFGLNGDMSVNRMRSLELLTIMSANKLLDLRAQERQLISQAVRIYSLSKNDVLERLSYLEIIKFFYQNLNIDIVIRWKFPVITKN